MAKAQKRSGEDKPGKTEYGIDPETFVTVWESSDSLDEVYEKLAVLCKQVGRQPIPKPIIVARASEYRSGGVDLKKYKRGPAKIDAQGLNNLVARVRAGKAVQPTNPAAPLAAPPEVPHEQLEKTVMGILDRLAKGGKKDK